MPRNLRFWTNVGLIAAAHLAVIYGLIRWSREDKNDSGQSIVWMGGGAGNGMVSEQPKTIHETVPTRRESRTETSRDEEDNRPVLTSAPSEIQLPPPAAGPTRTPSPKSTPKPTATPKKAPPKPTPKPTPRPTQKKSTIAKAKPSPKSKPKDEEKEDSVAKSEKPAPEKKKIVLAKNERPATKPVVEKSAATQTGSGKGTTAGTGGGRVGGSVNESQFGWYGSMLHDRFYSEWAQPNSAADAGAKNSVLVKLRIEKDGRVSSFAVVRPSGNAELDESVKAIAKRVTQVEPLPDGLGTGDHYDVKINFELNSE